MSEILDSNDITRDIEMTDLKLDDPFPTDESYKEDDNQISLHFDEVQRQSLSNDQMKIVLTVYGNDLRIKYPTKVGNVFSFLFVNGDPLIIIGPQCNYTIFMILFTIILDYMSIILFLIINLINTFLIFFVYQELYFLLKYAGGVIYILQVFSQLYCTIINPGIPHRNNYVSETIMHSIYQNVKYNNYKFDKYRVCKRCNILVTVDQDIVHCDDCDICVEGN